MPTLNKAVDGHYYIRGKDFHRPEEDDEYWTWQVYDLDATITTIRDAGYEVSPLADSKGTMEKWIHCH